MLFRSGVRAEFLDFRECACKCPDILPTDETRLPDARTAERPTATRAAGLSRTRDSGRSAGGAERKSVVEGKRVSVRVYRGGRRSIQIEDTFTKKRIKEETDTIHTIH